MSDAMSGFALAELSRIVANLIRIGVVSDLDPATARVKVKIGDMESDWIPWKTERAGATSTWSAPRAGEQVVILSPYGDLAQAVALPGLYQQAHPAPASSQDQEKVVWPDGSSATYDSASHTLTVDVGTGNVVVNAGDANVNTTTAEVTASATINMSAGTSITFDTPQATFTGKLNVTGLISFAGGITGTGGRGAQFDCSINSTGGITASTSLKVNGIEVLGHNHTGDSGGTTGPMQ